jgi:hypothetical protein
MSISTYSVTTTVGNAYISSGNTCVTFLSLCNYSAGNVTANVYVVPNGSSATSSNQVLSDLTILSDDTYQFYAGMEKLILANGDSVQINASANTALTALTSYTSI